MTDRLHVRWLIRRDLPAVLAIERASFEFDWGEPDFLRCLRRPFMSMVAERGDQILGYMVYELRAKTRRLLNFAVAPLHRRRGIGAAMIAHLKSNLDIHGRTGISLYVRDSNLPAQRFFASQGFRAVRVLRRYYEDSGEDAYRMIYRLAADADLGFACDVAFLPVED